MSLPAKKQEAVASVGAFLPDDGDKFEWQDGQRRQIRPVQCRPLRWPTTPKERFDLFDAWHDVAMQILHIEKNGRNLPLRLMAIAKKVIRWTDGEIIGSNETLASRAGFCAEKTISREVQEYIRLGILVSTMVWRRPGADFITVRTLRPALPVILPEGIILPETVPLSLDTSGPDLRPLSLDTSGPGGLDASGPATIDHRKGGSDAA